jgi:cell division protein FtsA
MSQKSGYAAIDVGSTGIRVAIGSPNEDGSLKVYGTATSESKGILKGSVVNLREASACLADSFNSAVSKAGIVPEYSILGISDPHISTATTIGKIYRESPSGTTKEDMAGALKNASPHDLPNGKELLHLIPISYTLDDIPGVSRPIGMHAQVLQVRATNIMGGANPLNSLKKAAKNAGINPKGIVFTSLCLGDSILTIDQRQQGTLLIDMGAGTTSVTYFENGAINGAKVIGVGGNNITNDIAVVLGIPYKDAENAKISSGTTEPWRASSTGVLPVGGFNENDTGIISQRELCAVIRERAEEIFQLVRNELDDMGIQTLPTLEVVVTGKTSTMRGMKDLAQDVLGCRVYIHSTASELIPANCDIDRATSILEWWHTHANAPVLKGELSNGKSYTNRSLFGQLAAIKRKLVTA